MKLIAATFLLGFAFAPNSAAELQVERRAKSTSSSGSLKGTAANPFNRGSSVCDQARYDLLWTACNILLLSYYISTFACHSLSLSLLQSGKGSKKEGSTVKVVYVPYEFIPPVAEGDEETIEYIQTADGQVYVPITVPVAGSRSESSDDEQIATIKVPTSFPSTNPSITSSSTPTSAPSTNPSITPSSTPTSAPSAAPTNERWCNMEYERDCRDSCFKERDCGINDACKKKCRKKCCSWD